MLIYSHKLEKYIRKRILPILLVNPKKYVIKGSFRRKIPYVTDIDISNYVTSSHNKNNIYENILQLFALINEYNTKFDVPHIIIVSVSCGTDDRFKLKDGDNFDDKIKHIESLLNADEVREIEFIMEKYSGNTEKKIFFINEIIWDYYKIRWSLPEIIRDEKILHGGLAVKFSDVIRANNIVLLQYVVSINSYPIGFDIIVIYEKPTYIQTYDEVATYQIKYSNYNKEYYYMLFPLRCYFSTKTDHENQIYYDQLNGIIEKKYGMYKQFMVRIDIYFVLYETNNLTIGLATLIVSGIIRDTKYLKDFESKTIEYIREASMDSTPDEKIKSWNTLLKILYDDMLLFVNNASRKYFFKYLELVPEDLKSVYYLG